MPFFDSKGVRIHYETYGEGPPVALIHGFASSIRDNWELTGWVKRLVEDGRRVAALDCRGHGYSEKLYSPDAYVFEAMAGDALGMMDALGIDRADLIGYSMGGYLALGLLVYNPQRFRRVVLGGIGGASRGVRDPAAIAEALETDEPSSIKGDIPRAFRTFAEGRGNDLKALAACIRRPLSGYDAQALAGIKTPVLVVVGAKDDLATGGDTLAAAIPGARFVSIPERDHLTVVPDRRFKKEALAFLGEEPLE